MNLRQWVIGTIAIAGPIGLALVVVRNYGGAGVALLVTGLAIIFMIASAGLRARPKGERKRAQR